MKTIDKIKKGIKKAGAVAAIGGMLLTGSGCADHEEDFNVAYDEINQIYVDGYYELNQERSKKGQPIYALMGVENVDVQVDKNTDQSVNLPTSAVKVLTNATAGDGSATHIMFTYPATENNIDEMTALANKAEEIKDSDSVEDLCEYVEMVRDFLKNNHKKDNFTYETDYKDIRQFLNLIELDANGQPINDASNNILQNVMNHHLDNKDYAESATINQILVDNASMSFDNKISVNNLDKTATVYSSIGIHEISYTIQVGTHANLTADQLTSIVTQYLLGRDEISILDESGKSIVIDVTFTILPASINKTTSSSTAVWDKVKSKIISEEIIENAPTTEEEAAELGV